MESSSSTAERFTLSGPSLKLDERIHAYRRDLADVALAGQLFAPHYARPLIRSCGALTTPLRSEASDTAPVISELLPGEQFAVLEYASGLAWGYCLQDHKVGYVEAIELVDAPPATHIVCEASAPIHGSGDIAAPVLARLPMGSRVAGSERGPCLSADIGCIPMSYLRPIGEYEEDVAAVAQRLFGCPYAMDAASTASTAQAWSSCRCGCAEYRHRATATSSARSDARSRTASRSAAATSSSSPATPAS